MQYVKRIRLFFGRSFYFSFVILVFLLLFSLCENNCVVVLFAAADE